jgi:hypothetical protein
MTQITADQYRVCTPEAAEEVPCIHHGAHRTEVSAALHNALEFGTAVEGEAAAAAECRYLWCPRLPVKSKWIDIDSGGVAREKIQVHTGNLAQWVFGDKALGPRIVISGSIEVQACGVRLPPSKCYCVCSGHAAADRTAEGFVRIFDLKRTIWSSQRTGLPNASTR